MKPRRFTPAGQEFLVAAALCCFGNTAEAKAARCSTSDDGSFSCHFRSMGRNGSFKISARGKPTYVLKMTEPGLAYGFVNYGSRSVALPGSYVRSRSEPGCWVNETTATKICAR